MAAYCWGMTYGKSPAGWLPVYWDQLRAQCLLTSMGELCFYLYVLYSILDCFYTRWFDAFCWLRDTGIWCKTVKQLFLTFLYNVRLMQDNPTKFVKLAVVVVVAFSSDRHVCWGKPVNFIYLYICDSETALCLKIIISLLHFELTPTNLSQYSYF